ncbi:putative rhomboid protein [Acanthamoeba castellanii mimivirus]|uniref:Putative rhomboid protein L523 n=6 Tax=Mimivirus TaxID=315393 RepID=RHBDL_MIMIV|nr:putative rhomboid protein [Acanthamoeba polyphaga mimivirus]YP_010777436.1 putative rhomboid protein [Acanthamoeba polyphaga mimivirus]Q5UQ86.1 RecName: Full=Putative rhomboid protein L523 [Acanthamoeba polyphaga mimivirus]AHJ40187.1 rhomboid protein [Samba virus]AKI80256.1 putative rhomboid protein [Acanthamoeba polyphaga mimivirus Kroon]ALR84113.1 putative rhomboid protein [Niemeyer virus]AMZ02968.1 putative rhomboid protein [Mimivirus Bombay]QTF49445.1 putative rhomboid protein [Mimivi
MRYVTYIVLLILVVIFFSPLNFFNTNSEIINYLIRTFYHANLQHLLANSFSFYMLSFLEDVMGHAKFAFCIIFIWILSSMLLLAEHTAFPSRKVYTVGFSGVIFGLIVVYLMSLGKNRGLSIAGLVLSIIPQFFVSGISYEGHICGMIAGFVYVVLFPLPKGSVDNQVAMF